MIENYLDFVIKVKGFSLVTAETYRQTLRFFANWAKIKKQNARWSTFTEEDIRSFIIDCSERGVSPQSINRYMSAINSFFSYLCRFHGLQINPCTNFEKLRVPKRLPMAIPEDVCKNYLERSWNGYQHAVVHMAIALMYYSGLRFSEVLNLKWTDIKERHIDVIGKGNKQRFVPISKNLKSDLSRWKFFAPTSSFVVPAFDGDKIGERTLRYKIFTALVSAGCDEKLAHPHALRHTFATRLSANGYPLLYLQKILGHNNLNTTQVYLSVNNSDLYNQFEKYEDNQ